MIWEEVFRLIPSLPHEDTQRQTNILSIMCCSRYLYHEISDNLYKDLKPILQPWPTPEEKKWMVVHISSKKVSVFRQLKDANTAEQFICKFPFDKVYQPRLDVNIPASSGSDPGQIIVLWKKINALIPIIKKIHCTPFVHIELSGKWRLRGKPRESVKDSNGARPDHDIVILPFTRLESWDFTFPKHLDEAILESQTKSKNSVMNRLNEKELHFTGSSYQIAKSCETVDIDNWLATTHTFLESEMSITRGRTARDLWLAHCMKWYTTKNGWDEGCRQRLVQLPPYRIAFFRVALRA